MMVARSPRSDFDCIATNLHDEPGLSDISEVVAADDDSPCPVRHIFIGTPSITPVSTFRSESQRHSSISSQLSSLSRSSPVRSMNDGLDATNEHSPTATPSPWGPWCKATAEKRSSFVRPAVVPKLRLSEIGTHFSPSSSASAFGSQSSSLPTHSSPCSSPCIETSIRSNSNKSFGSSIGSSTFYSFGAVSQNGATVPRLLSPKTWRSPLWRSLDTERVEDEDSPSEDVTFIRDSSQCINGGADNLAVMNDSAASGNVMCFISPRICSILTCDGAAVDGQGLVIRLQREINRRAHEWSDQNGLPLSSDAWIAAERSLLKSMPAEHRHSMEQESRLLDLEQSMHEKDQALEDCMKRIRDLELALQSKREPTSWLWSAVLWTVGY